jgi:RHS repeat-associated protein
LARTISSTDPLYRSTHFQYDPASNLITKLDAKGQTTTYQYDPANQLRTIVYSDGHTPNVSNLQYDNNGNRLTMSDGTGTSTYLFDSLNRLTSSKDGSGAVVGYGYDLNGNLTQLTYPGGNKVSRAFDAVSRMASITDWLGNTTRFSYDANSNLIQTTLPASTGEQDLHTFDAADNLISITDNGPTGTLASFRYTRDANNQVISEADSIGGAGSNQGNNAQAPDQGQATATPSASPAPTPSPTPSASPSPTASPGQGNGNGNGQGQGNGNGNNSQGQASQSSDPSLSPSPAPAPGNSGNSNGHGNGHGHGNANQISAQLPQDLVTTLPVTQGTRSPLADKSHGNSGNARHEGQSDNHNINYSYTPLNQLAGVNDETYKYSPADNLVQLINGTTQTFDAANQLLSSTSGNETTNFSYDLNGNRTSQVSPDQKTTTSFDQANRMTAFATAEIKKGHGRGDSRKDQTSATYSYNGDGLRMGKTVDGANSSFTWDISEILPLALSDSANSYVYGPGGLPLEQVSTSGQVLFFHHDQLGSTRLLTDTQGQFSAAFTFDPYGNLIHRQGSVSTPLLYSGQYQDAESGLYNLRARYYDSQTSQFVSIDPMFQLTSSRYGYVYNNPLTASDPSGMFCFPPWGDNCDVAIANSFVSSGFGKFANGFANGFTFGGAAAIESLTSKGRGNLAADVCSPLFWGGFAVGVVANRVLTRGLGGPMNAGKAPPNFANISPKIANQMLARGWTREQIQSAYEGGQQVNAINKATGGAATRYINSQTGQSVVIDNATGQVIHVGGRGFLYGPGSGDLP